MFLFMDTETAGVDLEFSLLSVNLDIRDENFNLVKNLYLDVCPNDRRYIVAPSALAVNKIDLAEHDKKAVGYSFAYSQILGFLNGFAAPLIPVGHNVGFDIRHVQHHIVPRGIWEAYVSYRALDTQVIGQFLKLTGKLPASVSGSMGSLIEHFKIWPQHIGYESVQQHNARYDTLMTIEVMKKLQTLCQ